MRVTRERPVGTGKDDTPAGGVQLTLSVCISAIATTILVVVSGGDMRYSSWLVKGIQHPTYLVQFCFVLLAL